MDFCYTPNNQMGYMFNLAWDFNQPVNLDTAKVTGVREYICIEFKCKIQQFLISMLPTILSDGLHVPGCISLQSACIV